MLFYYLQKLLVEQCRASLQRTEKFCPCLYSTVAFFLPIPSPHKWTLLKSKRDLRDVAVIPEASWPTFRCCCCICAVTADPSWGAASVIVKPRLPCLCSPISCKSKCSFPLTKSGPGMYFLGLKTVCTCPLDPQTSGLGASWTEGKSFSILLHFEQGTDFRSASFWNVPATKLNTLQWASQSLLQQSHTLQQVCEHKSATSKVSASGIWVDHFHPWNISWQYGKGCSNLEKRGAISYEICFSLITFRLKWEELISRQYNIWIFQ